jgi:hypothetical protein
MHTRIGYPREMLDPEIEAATRVLLQAAGDERRRLPAATLIPARSDPQKY